MTTYFVRRELLDQLIQLLTDTELTRIIDKLDHAGFRENYDTPDMTHLELQLKRHKAARAAEKQMRQEFYDNYGEIMSGSRD